MGVLQSLLDRQYEQYQQFKVNNEQMQQVYHDIKHLINYIRSVSVSQKYEKRASQRKSKQSAILKRSTIREIRCWTCAQQQKDECAVP